MDIDEKMMEEMDEMDEEGEMESEEELMDDIK